jgi:hypothetical protein
LHMALTDEDNNVRCSFDVMPGLLLFGPRSCIIS